MDRCKPVQRRSELEPIVLGWPHPDFQADAPVCALAVRQIFVLTMVSIKLDEGCCR